MTEGTLNADRLLELYERVADAPDAVPRLRRFVLDLAVRGRLVEQDPGDEPASELLEQIAAEKKRIGVKYSTFAVDHDQVPFELPAGWAWTRIGQVCSKTGSGSTPRGGKEAYQQSGIPFLRSQNVYNDGIRLDNAAFIEPSTHKRMKGSRVLAGDLLLNITGGSIGRCGQVPNDFVEGNVSQHVAIVRPALREVATFLHYLILSPYFQAFIFNEQTGAGRGGLPKNRMDKILVALPPLAEQHRIVAKVEELTALLDRLEEAHTAVEATRDRLTTASLARLTAPDTTPEEFPAHARFALDSLRAITDRADQIRSLRQSIRHLAVRGRLVEQDPDDEPVSDFLRKVMDDKRERALSLRDRRAGMIEPLAYDETPYDIPSSWSWLRLGDITISRDGERVPVSKAEREKKEKIYDYYGASGVIDKIDSYLFDQPLLLIGEDGANLINRSTPIAFIAKGRYWVNNHAHVLDGVSNEYLRYLELFINATDLKPFVTGTAQPKMNQAKMNRIPVAIPPQAEQDRILSKVDELMALCDQLAESLTSATVAKQHLLESLLREALPNDARNKEAA